MNSQEKIKIFNSLFKGRSDVFARRWERWGTDISGYSPVYIDKEKQKYAPLSDYFIEQHLRGNIVLGAYPLLTDNTSWFVVADFDGENWLESTKSFLSKCSEYSLLGYVERSRSGNGGHVWFFFDQPYPAHKSRKIFLHLIKESGSIDQFDKDDSFDRIFPNQDYLSGKGLGNLIALPLQGNSIKLGNSLFLDPENSFNPLEDQWDFISATKRISPISLDEIFNKLSKDRSDNKKISYGKSLSLTVGSYISIPKQQMFKPLTDFLTENLNFFNSDYIVRRNMGLSTYKVEKYFKAIAKDDHHVLIPRGFLGELITYLNDNNIDFVISDALNKLPDINIKPEFQLFDYQREALEYFSDDNEGILVAPPGSGKTIMGLALIAKKFQPALIITHRKQIYNQWLDRIEDFLKIPKREIGQYVSVKQTVKSPVTVAMIQTLAKAPYLKDVASQFGLVLVDECHHMPARTFRDVITQFYPKYLYGLTATPTRKNNDEKLIFVYLGDVLHTVPKDYNQQTTTASPKLKLIIQETNLSIPFSIGVAQFSVLSKILTFDSQRNQMIVEDILKEAKLGKKCLVLTERKDHAEVLSLYLKKDFEVITLTGTLAPRKRREKEKQVSDGHFQILIATGQLLGEGTSLKNIDCLFLVYLFSYEGKLIQYIGRIQHGKANIRRIYDYRDKNVEYLEKLFKKRAKYYKTLAPF